MNARSLSRLTFKHLLFIGIAAFAVLGFLGYGLFEARKLLVGPRVSITSPRDGSAVSGPVIAIRGSVANAAFFTINGKQAFADGQGNFSAALTPPPGYTIIEIAARDRFGRTTASDIHITVMEECLLPA